MQLAASLLGGNHACFSRRKHARVAPHRLPRAAAPAAAPEHADRASVLVNIETSNDGSVMFHFGAEAGPQEAAAESATPSTLPPPAAAALATPDHLAQQHVAVAAAAAATTAATAIDASHRLTSKHIVGTAAAANGSTAVRNVRGSGGKGTAVLPQQQAASTAKAAAQLNDLLQRSTSSSSDEEDGGVNGNGGRPRKRRSSRQRQHALTSTAPSSTQPANGAAPATASSTKQKGSSRQAAGAAAGRQQQRAGAVAAAAPSGQRRVRPQQAAASTAPCDPRSISYKDASAGEVVGAYEALCDWSELDEALLLVKECIRAGRSDVLSKLKHYRFLRPAATRKAVKPALRFVQLLPRQYVDARTYNMLMRVCAQAGDLCSAMQVAEMVQVAEIKMDAILYTTLISTCAAAGDAEKAFQLYGEMKAGGVAPDKMVYSSVVKACAEHIVRLPPSERRQQLVLLERAFNLVEDMKGARIPTDAAVWNALVTVAGRAGQLQRAFNVLEDMIDCGTRPNDRTYASLIDACARAGDKTLAMRVYRKALREGCGGTLMVYSASVNACINAREGCDSDTAMSVYQDLQMNRVEPDNQLYGMLMMAAGRSGDLVLVKELYAEMQREGLKPCAGTASALLAVHIQHDQLAEAQGIYRQLRAAGQWPHDYAMNKLLNAYASSFRLGDVVSLVCEMAEGGKRPDDFTFSAIFNACQRADEAELALDVARLMKLRGIRMDETHANLLMRICYNRLRQSWIPGGYPPHRASNEAGSGASGPTSSLPGSRRSHERQRLLEALTPRGRRVELREPVDVAWLAQSFSIYREAVAAGVKPSMRLLNRTLMCLRVAWEGKQANNMGIVSMASAEALLPHHLQPQRGPLSSGVQGAGGGLGGSGSVAARGQEKTGVESVYHAQAISILEEAIISNVVPSFKTDSDQAIDLRGMPPAVAEVYVVTVLSAIQRQCEVRRVITQNITFLVPEYDGSKVFMPSHLTHVHFEEIPAAPGYECEEDDEYCMSFAEADAAFAAASRGEQGEASGGAAAADGGVAAAAGAAAGGAVDERTGLGVAGVLRRLQMWAREHGERGYILLEAKELTRWCKTQERAAERRSAIASPVQKPYGQKMQPLSGLQQQQRQIRMGF